MTYFVGWNGFRQVNADKLQADIFQHINSDQNSLQHYDCFYNAVALANTVKITKMYEQVLEFDAPVTKLCGNSFYIIVLLKSGDLYKVVLHNGERIKLNFINIENDSTSDQNDNHEEVVLMDCTDTLAVVVTSKNTIYSIPTKIATFPKHLKIQKISCGYEHCLILTTNGDVYCWGGGLRGQLGIGTIQSITEPMLIEALGGLKIDDISAGGWHSAAVSACGDIYTWGWNQSGQLGLRDFGLSAVHVEPTLVELKQEEESDINITRVYCGTRHTVFQTKCGEIFGCGWNRYCQLATAPEEIVIESDVKNMISPEFIKMKLPNDLEKFKIIGGPWSTVLSS